MYLFMYPCIDFCLSVKDTRSVACKSIVTIHRTSLGKITSSRFHSFLLHDCFYFYLFLHAFPPIPYSICLEMDSIATFCLHEVVSDFAKFIVFCFEIVSLISCQAVKCVLCNMTESGQLRSVKLQCRGMVR